MKASFYRHIVILTFLFSFCDFISHAQTPNQVIKGVNQRFAKVNDYTADALVTCDITFLKINPIHVKVFYKRPDHFKVKSTGILILPKQNTNFIFNAIADTGTFTAVKTGEEKMNDVLTQIINVIPNTDTSDLILGKFWIDAEKSLVMKSQLTTKSQGTILIENFFDSSAQYALPDKMIFTVDIQKFKIPKAVSLDLNRKSSSATDQPKEGKITLVFSDYKINQGLSDSVFK